MRKIKFRAKKKNKNEIVYGYYAYNEQTGNHLIATEKELTKQQAANFVSTDFGSNYRYWIVEPETISQYTGLTDINGYEVYENDALIAINTKTNTKVTGEVKFIKGSFSLVISKNNIQKLSEFRNLERIDKNV